MDTKCRNCGSKISDPLLIMCPNCGESLRETGRRPMQITEEQENQIVKRLWKRLLKWLVGGFSVLTVISVILLLIGLVKAYMDGTKHLEEILVERVDKEFETARITDTVQSVAKTQAKSIIESQVNPEVTRFKSETEKRINEFGGYLDRLRESYERDYQTLSIEVAKLKKRNEISQLGDKGIQDASRAALEKLEEMSKSDADAAIRFAALSEVARIKGFWLSATRLGGQHFVLTGADGKNKEKDDITTQQLINALLTHPNWIIRALVAKELGKRKEKGVPEGLMECINKDQNLEVVRDAVKAFESITGYERIDVFKYEPVRDWWAEHASEVNSKLNESQAKVTK